MEQLLESISWQMIMPMIVVWLALMVTALINCMKAEQTNGPKWVWILIIIFINTIGPVLYFIIGRKQD